MIGVIARWRQRRALARLDRLTQTKWNALAVLARTTPRP